jgi:hypothetical protein
MPNFGFLLRMYFLAIFRRVRYLPLALDQPFFEAAREMSLSTWGCA